MTLLLFDHNLSPRLVDRLSAVFPGSIHVSTVGLAEVSDREVWDYARENGYFITTKDADFTELGVVWGVPPKVVTMIPKRVFWRFSEWRITGAR